MFLLGFPLKLLQLLSHPFFPPAAMPAMSANARGHGRRCRPGPCGPGTRPPSEPFDEPATGKVAEPGRRADPRDPEAAEPRQRWSCGRGRRRQGPVDGPRRKAVRPAPGAEKALGQLHDLLRFFLPLRYTSALHVPVRISRLGVRQLGIKESGQDESVLFLFLSPGAWRVAACFV